MTTAVVFYYLVPYYSNMVLLWGTISSYSVLRRLLSLAPSLSLNIRHRPCKNYHTHIFFHRPSHFPTKVRIVTPPQISIPFTPVIMKVAILAATLASASAFVPQTAPKFG